LAAEVVEAVEVVVIAALEERAEEEVGVVHC
jgi:hypothetical protein